MAQLDPLSFDFQIASMFYLFLFIFYILRKYSLKNINRSFFIRSKLILTWDLLKRCSIYDEVRAKQIKNDILLENMNFFIKNMNNINNNKLLKIIFNSFYFSTISYFLINDDFYKYTIYKLYSPLNKV